MPKQPPKKWWKDCTKGVEKRGDVRDPDAVCGALWYQKMTEKQRRAATRKHEALKRKHKR